MTAAICSVIGLPTLWLITDFVVNTLGLGPDKVSLLATFRAMMALAYPICFLPIFILTAFVLRWLWKKSSLLANVAILGGLSGEFALILIAILTVFDLFFLGLPVTIQAPLMALSLGIALLATAETARIRQIRNFIEKSFK